MFELVDSAPQSAVIKVIGVGGGGGNAVQHMVSKQVDGVDFIAANTDAQALKSLDAQTTLQIGSGITKGLGAGANPQIGRAAAMEEQSAKEYNEWANTCGANADSATKRIFEDLVADEERHYDGFDTQEEHLKKFGEQFLALQSIERSKTLAGRPGAQA